MNASPGASGPLSGMRVLDLSQQLPGPYATVLLASLGAEVVKIEPPAGDAARQLDPPMFDRVNAGKRPMTLNLKDTGDQTRLRELVAQTDVFIEGFRPGVARRLGCDYATLRQVRPALVYCSVSGFGQEGPLAHHPSHDLTMHGMVGALAAPGEIDRIGIPWVDLGTGTAAALAITAYWHARRGVYLDLAMLDVASAWASIKPQALTETEPTYGTFALAQGERVALALLEDAMWLRLCTALGWTDWLETTHLSTYLQRRDHAQLIRDRLTTTLQTLPLTEVRELADRHDLPIVPVDASAVPEIQEQLQLRAPSTGEPWHRAVPLPDHLLTPLRPIGDPEPT